MRNFLAAVSLTALLATPAYADDLNNSHHQDTLKASLHEVGRDLAKISRGLNFDQIDGAVVNVSTLDGHGTGFFLDQTHIQTAFHVIKDAVDIARMGGNPQFVIWFSDGTSMPFTPMAANEKSDIAILQVSPNHPKVQPVHMVCALPRLDEKITTYGYPLGFGIPFVDHTYVAAAKGIHTPEVEVPLAVSGQTFYEGQSGGPVFDDITGDVIGMVTAKGTGPAEGLAFFTPSIFLCGADGIAQSDGAGGFKLEPNMAGLGQ